MEDKKTRKIEESDERKRRAGKIRKRGKAEGRIMGKNGEQGEKAEGKK